MKISVAVITYNEEKKLGQCLESVKWADEIVVLDSFSTDKTVEIAKKYTDKVFQHTFDGHIQQKNRALDLCSNEWVLSLDADEVLSDGLKEEILAIKNSGKEPEADGFYINRKIRYLGRWIRHGNWYPDYKLRFFKRSRARWGGINPHDTIILNGKTARLNGELLHYSYDSVADHLNTVNKFTSIMAKEYHEKGKKPSLLNLTLRPFFGFFKSYILKRGFLEGKRGFIIAVIDSYYVFLKFVKVFEIQLKQKAERN